MSSVKTGPNSAVTGTSYLYIETSNTHMDTGGKAIFKSNILNKGKFYCFVNYHLKMKRKQDHLPKPKSLGLLCS